MSYDITEGLFLYLPPFVSDSCSLLVKRSPHIRSTCQNWFRISWEPPSLIFSLISSLHLVCFFITQFRLVTLYFQNNELFVLLHSFSHPLLRSSHHTFYWFEENASVRLYGLVLLQRLSGGGQRISRLPGNAVSSSALAQWDQCLYEGLSLLTQNHLGYVIRPYTSLK